MYASRLSVYVSGVPSGIHLSWHSGMCWLSLEMTENGHTAVVVCNAETNLSVWVLVLVLGSLASAFIRMCACNKWKHLSSQCLFY